MPRGIVIIPTYNEAENVEALVTAVLEERFEVVSEGGDSAMAEVILP